MRLNTRLFLLSMITLTQEGLVAEPSGALEPFQGSGQLKSLIELHGLADNDAPMVQRTMKVFRRVASAADRSAARLPQLLILNGPPRPMAEAFPSGQVVISRKGLEVCYQSGLNYEGDSRLALVLGHELAHLTGQDFDRSTAEEAMREGRQRRRKRSRPRGFLQRPANPKQRDSELLADRSGFLCAFQAGYDPTLVLREESQFFQDWAQNRNPAVPSPSVSHPSIQDRIAFLKTQWEGIASKLPLYHFAVRLYQLGRYRDAVELFTEFKKRFASREVLNNLGLCYYQLALRRLARCNGRLITRFHLPVMPDPHTLAQREFVRSATSQCLNDLEFEKLRDQAEDYLVQASNRDRSYLPSRINLASLWIIQERGSEALSPAQEAVRLDPGDPTAQNVLALAWFLLGSEHSMDDAFELAIEGLAKTESLHPHFSAAYFNHASILSQRGRNANAKPLLEKFLTIETHGPFADDARDRLGLDPPERGRPKPARPRFDNPISLGPVSERKKRQLEALGEKIRHDSFTIYWGEKWRALQIDSALEIVEERSRSKRSADQILLDEGQPLRRIRTPSGAFLLYPGYGHDIMDGRMVSIVYFEESKSSLR